MRVDNPDGIDVGELLARPIPARLATDGPTVRPIWFLWEDEAFWWITGSWSSLPERLAHDPEVALVVDTCDVATGEVLQLLAWGRAEVVAFDADRARRKLGRYLGEDEDRWASRFTEVFTDPSSEGLVRLSPRTVRVSDLSFGAA